MKSSRLILCVLCLLICFCAKAEATRYYPIMNAEGQYGAIDENGKIILSPQFDGLRPLVDSRSGEVRYYVAARYKKHPERAYKKGDTKVVPQTYTEAVYTSDGRLVKDFQKKTYVMGVVGDKYLFVRGGGTHRLVRASDFSFVRKISSQAWIKTTSDGIAIVNTGKRRVTFLNDELKEISRAGDFGELSYGEGLFCAEKDGKYGFIDESGKVAIPFEYDYAYSFSEGLAAVCVDSPRLPGEKRFKYGRGRWGFIDKTGAWVIPPEHDGSKGLFGKFEDGYAYFCSFAEDGVILYRIDRDGNRVDYTQAHHSEFHASNGGMLYFDLDLSNDKCLIGFKDAAGKEKWTMEGWDASMTTPALATIYDYRDLNNCGLFNIETGKWLADPGEYAQVLGGGYWDLLFNWVDTANESAIIGVGHASSGAATGDARINAYAEGDVNNGFADCDIWSRSGELLLTGVQNVFFTDGYRVVGFKDGVYGLMDMSGNFVWKEA